MNQIDLISRLSQNITNYAWFLGAGASRTAGLPTASDIIWELKRYRYCMEENQDISRQDLQNDSVRRKLQSYFDSTKYPSFGDEDEYAIYFEKIFEGDKERQRQYISKLLSTDSISLSIGNRILGALITEGLTRIVFTTNFDDIVEKSVAEMGHKTFSSFHLEGAYAANVALNNEQFPLYCKLHGDFRFESLKNLTKDLQNQNKQLSTCLTNAGNRFGFVVTGYSGRDKSIMRLFQSTLESHNPFPHGLYWTVLSGTSIHPSLENLIKYATSRNVESAIVEVQTYDAFMLHLWRNIKEKSDEIDKKVRKTHITNVNVPISSPGERKNLVRFTGLPILSIPKRCYVLSFRNPKEWGELRQIMHDSRGSLILTKGRRVLAWGMAERLHKVFGRDLESMEVGTVPSDLRSSENYYFKPFLERAISQSLVRDRPLLVRSGGSANYLIINPHVERKESSTPLLDLLAKTSGTVPSLISNPNSPVQEARQVEWAEALRVSVEQTEGKLWLVVQPDIWIWPYRSRRNAQDFMRERRRDRFNMKFNDLLDAWLLQIFGDFTRGSNINLSIAEKGNDLENPSFTLGTRTAYTGRQMK